jgi:putative membrane protein
MDTRGSRLVVASLTWLAVGTAYAQVREPPPRAATPDELFVEEVAADLWIEAELARLATEKATRPELRQLGQALRLVSNRAQEELRALAAQKQIAIDPSPDPEMAARVAAIDGLSGMDFDDAYLNAASSSRERAVALFTSQAESWGDPDLKAWAERWLPSLKQQLARTQELRMTPSAANPQPRR